MNFIFVENLAGFLHLGDHWRLAELRLIPLRGEVRHWVAWDGLDWWVPDKKLGRLLISATPQKDRCNIRIFDKKEIADSLEFDFIRRAGRIVFMGYQTYDYVDDAHIAIRMLDTDYPLSEGDKHQYKPRPSLQQRGYYFLALKKLQ